MKEEKSSPHALVMQGFSRQRAIVKSVSDVDQLLSSAILEGNHAVFRGRASGLLCSFPLWLHRFPHQEDECRALYRLGGTIGPGRN